jgi:hypothetical protein
MKTLFILPCIILTTLIGVAFCSHTTFDGFPHQGSLAHIAPRGLGYTSGYTTANLFITPKIYPKGYCFVEGRAHIFDNGKFASNLGFGTRWKTKNSLASYGVNLFYDSRQQHHFFHQVGGGVEFQKNRFLFYKKMEMTCLSVGCLLYTNLNQNIIKKNASII